MGLAIVTIARLTDRSRRLLSGGRIWRLIATALLLSLVIPVLLTAAVATLPVLLTVGMVMGVRNAWHWQAERLRRAGGRRH